MGSEGTPTARRKNGAGMEGNKATRRDAAYPIGECEERGMRKKRGVGAQAANWRARVMRCERGDPPSHEKAGVVGEPGKRPHALRRRQLQRSRRARRNSLLRNLRATGDEMRCEEIRRATR